MEYTALYRKYRPKNFSEVIGQEPITRTLENQIKSGRVGHAYLFSGSRGVGKTTLARIFALGVNCESPNTPKPCFSCEVCKALFDKANIDIIEIDAASNNGVDEARELRERAKYPPVLGKYKVFIIDEVHMLTGAAFNALLKTLEEPPSSAIFILATTEAHKLPATILSRCMRFDFSLVPQPQLEKLISDIYKKEGKEFEPDAIKAIAAQGEGSVRDALSIADKCLSISQGKLTYNDVIASLGIADNKTVSLLFKAIANNNIKDIFTVCTQLWQIGKSPILTAKELCQHARNLMTVKANSDLLNLPKTQIDVLLTEAQNLSNENIFTILDIFSSIETELKYSVSPQISFETACIRAAKLFNLELNALEGRITRLEKQLQNISIERNNNSQAPITEIKNELPEARVLWGKLITYLRNNSTKTIYSIVSSIKDYEIKNKELIILGNDENYLALCDKDVIDTINIAFTSMGYQINVKIEKKNTEDIDKEIAKLKKMIGKTPLDII